MFVVAADKYTTEITTKGKQNLVNVCGGTY
jgi:hypothetical protein